MEQNETESQKNATPKFFIPAAVLGIIVLAVVAFYVMGQNKSSQTQQRETAQQSVTTAQTSTATVTQGETQRAATESEYKDGEFDAVGNYISPGGPRELGVILTLNKGVITEAEAEVRATDATSKRFQTEFVKNFKSQVIGKNIDEVKVRKVSGSSLSPNGFMDALEKIKEEAQG